MDTQENEVRYFCNHLCDGRIFVVASGTLEDVYNSKRKLPRWTVCYTKEYLNSFDSDRIIWYQQEFDYD